MFLFNPYDRNNLINKKYSKKGEKPFEQYLYKADDVPLPRDEDDYDEYLDSIEKTRLVPSVLAMWIYSLYAFIFISYQPVLAHG